VAVGACGISVVLVHACALFVARAGAKPRGESFPEERSRCAVGPRGTFGQRIWVAVNPRHQPRHSGSRSVGRASWWLDGADWRSLGLFADPAASRNCNLLQRHLQQGTGEDGVEVRNTQTQLDRAHLFWGWRRVKKIIGQGVGRPPGWFHLGQPPSNIRGGACWRPQIRGTPMAGQLEMCTLFQRSLQGLSAMRQRLQRSRQLSSFRTRSTVSHRR